jgi:nucleoside-diphosphate-sugar epimerase
VGCLNIGTGVETSTNQVFEKVTQSLGLDYQAEHGPERPGEQVSSALNYAKAKEILGWEPTVQFDQGVVEVAQWYKSR